jgi:hypothetical protein
LPLCLSQLKSELLEELIADMKEVRACDDQETPGIVAADAIRPRGDKRLKADGSFHRLMDGGFFGCFSAAGEAAAAAETLSSEGDIRREAEIEMRKYWAAPTLAFWQDVDRDGENIAVLNDPLEQWAKNRHEYPNLLRLARKYLCVPATSAPSERVFSSASLTISKLRNCLSPDTARALIFLRNTWPQLDELAQDRQVKRNCENSVAQIQGTVANKGKKRQAG